MKQRPLLMLLILGIFLITLINGCVPSKDVEQAVISELKAKYSEVNDYYFSVKITTFDGSSNCIEMYAKKAPPHESNKYKLILDSACEKNSSKMSTIIYDNDVMYLHESNVNTGQLSEVVYKETYSYDIAEKVIGEIFFEGLVNNILSADRISLMSDTFYYAPLGRDVYKINIWNLNEPSVDILVDKETYLIVKMEGEEDGKRGTWEIQDLKINEGIQDSVFIPSEGYPVSERPSQIDEFKQKCETVCESKNQNEYQGKLYYDYCNINMLVPGTRAGILENYVYCWEDPINVECVEITCGPEDVLEED